jgi:hypothetical protein
MPGFQTSIASIGEVESPTDEQFRSQAFLAEFHEREY